MRARHLPWSPLAGGFLTGKYRREEKPAEGRLSGGNPFGNSKFTDRNWRLLDVLRGVAAEIGAPPAQVALAWALRRPGVSALLLGASRPEQLHDNLSALQIVLGPKQLATLDEASAADPAFPYSGFTPQVRRSIFGGATVTGWGAPEGG